VRGFPMRGARIGMLDGKRERERDRDGTAHRARDMPSRDAVPVR
jgi:hypothetical protein